MTRKPSPTPSVISPIPALAPRGTPQAVVDSAHSAANILDNPPGVRGQVTRHTLFVLFTSSASVAQKDSALALIGADLIGGMYVNPDNPNGHYYVRLRNAVVTAPDSSSGPILRAEQALRALPYVRSVLYDRLDSSMDIMFRRPESTSAVRQQVKDATS